MFFVGLRGCKISSFTLSEKYRLWVFKNRMLKNIFGSRREKARGELKKLNDKKPGFNYLRSIIQVMKCNRMEERKHGVRLG
jgi:hypothetical protein